MVLTCTVQYPLTGLYNTAYTEFKGLFCADRCSDMAIFNFQNGGRLPSWIYYVHVWTTRKEYWWYLSLCGLSCNNASDTCLQRPRCEGSKRS